MSIKSDAMIVTGGVVLVVIGVWYLKSLASGAIDSVTENVGAAVDWTVTQAKEAVPYVNPADSGNIVNRGVNGIGGAITGDQNWTLGGQIYDWTH